MKILYAEDEEVLRELYAMQIDAATNCEIIEVSSGNEGLEKLKSDPEIVLVISDYRMSNGNGDVLYKYIQEKNLNIPFILISTYEPQDMPGLENFSETHSQNAYFSKPITNFKAVTDKIKEILHKKTQTKESSSAEDLNSTSTSETSVDYCKVKLLRFLRFNNSNCPIFIKLSENKYVKLINQEDLYDTDLVEKYSKKNVSYFYIKNSDFLSFISYYKEILESSISKEMSNHEKIIDVQLASVSFIHEIVSNVGVNSTVIEVVDKTINSTIEFVKKNENIFKYLEFILKKQSFIFEHSLTTAYIAAAIAREMDWFTNATIQKITFSALLHDCTLNEYSGSVPVEDTLDNFSEELTRAEVQLITNHPVTASELLKGQQGVPPDVDWIILCHHERADGTGYPRSLNSQQIPPLACVFIVAENFARRIYSKNLSKEDIECAVKNMTIHFDRGNFKKAVEGLISVTKKAK